MLHSGRGGGVRGKEALLQSSTGSFNSAFGAGALGYLTSGDGNIALGVSAGAYLTSGSHNIYVGNLVYGPSAESNTIRIGHSTNQVVTYVAGIYGANATARAVYINSDGKLGTMSSSRRYKEQIADMNAESDVLLRLRPVSFYYRPDLDETHLRQYGLVAEEVAEVAPELVAYDKDGAPQTVRYHFVNAMLLNEVQKQRRLVEEQRRVVDEERRANEEQRATIEMQESKIQELEARLAKLEAARADH